MESWVYLVFLALLATLAAVSMLYLQSTGVLVADQVTTLALDVAYTVFGMSALFLVLILIGRIGRARS